MHTLNYIQNCYIYIYILIAVLGAKCTVQMKYTHVYQAKHLTLHSAYHSNIA